MSGHVTSWFNETTMKQLISPETGKEIWEYDEIMSYDNVINLLNLIYFIDLSNIFVLNYVI
jgi:hypothetical protein